MNPDVALGGGKKFDFASALRSFMRLDPDVIMVGEIRDEETAHIALEAAMTGHLVFSTIHTNDAPSALERLTQMGLPRFVVANTMKAVLAQRLSRRLCKDCKVEGTSPRGDRHFRSQRRQGAARGQAVPAPRAATSARTPVTRAASVCTSC